MEHVPTVPAPSGVRPPLRLLRLAGDDRLVQLVRGGHEAAFEAIYDRHHRAILGFCRHMLGTREEAEDAVQQAFLAAYRDLSGSTKPIELRPWLFAIARNRCLSMLRARRPQVALDDVEQPSTDGLTAIVEQREDLRELLGDVALLPEDQRAALLLAELGALDHAGIAAVLGCPREKVKALVFQARSSLAASREARATSCEQIRAELATATGAALRRGPLRRHLRTCDGCRVFRAEVATQRKLFALALPVLPGAALKAGVLGALGAAHAGGGTTATAGAGIAAAGGAGAGASGGGAMAALASAGAAKVAVSLALAGAIAGGGALTLAAHHHPARTAHTAARDGSLTTRTTPAGTASPASAGTLTSPGAGPLGTSQSPVAGTTPPRSAQSNGFLPQRANGGGNGAAARGRALSRGSQSTGRANRSKRPPQQGSSLRSSRGAGSHRSRQPAPRRRPDDPANQGTPPPAPAGKAPSSPPQPAGSTQGSDSPPAPSVPVDPAAPSG